MTLGTKLFIGCFTLFVLPTVFAFQIHTSLVQKNILKQVHRTLNGKTTVQKARLLEMISSHYDRVKGVTSRTKFRNLLSAHITSQNPSHLDSIKKILLDAQTPFPQIQNILVFSREKELLVSTHQLPANTFFMTHRKLSKVKPYPFIQFNHNDTQIMCITAPIELGDELIGFISVVQTHAVIKKISQDFTGLGKTGETLIATRDSNGDAVFIVSQRFTDSPNALKRVPKSRLDIPITQALYRYQGPLPNAIDYRGIPVIAQTRYIFEEDWGLVVKIDKTEAFASIALARKIANIICLFLISIGILSSIIIARIINQPINQFKKTLYSLQKGNFLTKTNIYQTDELGDLAKIIDDLVDILGKEKHKRATFENALNQKNKDLEVLLYITTHDLKEPLRAVIFFSDAVSKRYAEQLDSKAQEFLDRATNSAKRMNELLDSIQLFSKSRTFEVPLDFIDGKSVVEKVLLQLKLKLQTTLTDVKIAEHLPKIKADPTWAQQAVYNLIINAIKFKKPGAAPEIEILGCEIVDDSKRYTGFKVCDRGIGIDEKYHDKIFELFQRAVGREIEGYGAGLSIVKQIALRHGGDAWVISRPGGGSIFYLTFQAS